MQKTQINKFIPSSEVDCSELLVPWLAECPNWRHEQLAAVLLVKEFRRIFVSDIRNIEGDSQFWFNFCINNFSTIYEQFKFS
jgi:hypothetical protein